VSPKSDSVLPRNLSDPDLAFKVSRLRWRREMAPEATNHFEVETTVNLQPALWIADPDKALARYQTQVRGGGIAGGTQAFSLLTASPPCTAP